MKTKEEILIEIAGVEAGYVNDPDDLGGETNHGITRETANEWRKLWPKYNWNGDMRTLPRELALEIYDKGWWQKLHLDRIYPKYPVLAEKMMDYGLNAGRKNCGTSFQRLLNVFNKDGSLYADLLVDGWIGDITMSRFDEFCATAVRGGVDDFTVLLYSMQGYHYVDICEKRKRNEMFMRGWARRVKLSWRSLFDVLFDA